MAATREGMSPQRTATIIGLTGGIASGKSTVAARWLEHGAAIIDADQVAREVVQQGEDAYQAICREFGAEILLPDLELDRPKLGRIVFADPDKLETLNRIVHPAMMRRIGEQVQHYQHEGFPWIVYEAALIIEKNLAPTLAEVVSVLADPETQIARLMRRNSLTRDEANDRMAAQTDNPTRRQASDHIIENNGTIADLHRHADQQFARLVSTYGSL